jgi:hypothetical protein
MLWVIDAAIAAWRAVPRTMPGGQARYSDTAIMVRLVFHQPLRQTEGLLSSLLALLGAELPVPDHTTISRHAARRTPVLSTALSAGPVTLVIDSTGLKIYGAGEWHHDKHGVRGPRTWRKLHLAVDATTTIVAATLTTTDNGDASQVGPLLDQTTCPIDTVMADGAYDATRVTKPSPNRMPAPRSSFHRATAVQSDAAETAPTQRDRHIQSIAERGRLGWQHQTEYGKRSKAETAIARYKRILGGQLHARTFPGPQAEAVVGVTILNRMIDQARPNSVRSA